MTQPTSEEFNLEKNSPEEIERGEALGLWIRTGLALRTMKVSVLAREISRSRGYLGTLANKNGISERGRYTRPSEEIIDAIADALNIDANEGRRAAGYAEKTEPNNHPTLHRYTIGNSHNGDPITLTLTHTLSDEDLERIRFAMELTLLRERQGLEKQ